MRFFTVLKRTGGAPAAAAALSAKAGGAAHAALASTAPQSLDEPRESREPSKAGLLAAAAEEPANGARLLRTPLGEPADGAACDDHGGAALSPAGKACGNGLSSPAAGSGGGGGSFSHKIWSA